MGLFPLLGIQLMELQRNTHHVYRLMYHFVWIPKYRHKVFSEPYSSELKGIIEKIGYNYDIDIVELEIPEDHLHMVVRGVPRMSPSDVMQIIKSISAREFFRRYLVWMVYRQTPEQIGIDLVSFPRFARTRLRIQGRDTHQSHQAPNSFAVYWMAFVL
jgi:putative transposase